MASFRFWRHKATQIIILTPHNDTKLANDPNYVEVTDESVIAGHVAYELLLARKMYGYKYWSPRYGKTANSKSSHDHVSGSYNGKNALSISSGTSLEPFRGRLDWIGADAGVISRDKNVLLTEPFCCSGKITLTGGATLKFPDHFNWQKMMIVSFLQTKNKLAIARSPGNLRQVDNFNGDTLYEQYLNFHNIKVECMTPEQLAAHEAIMQFKDDFVGLAPDSIAVVRLLLMHEQQKQLNLGARPNIFAAERSIRADTLDLAIQECGGSIASPGKGAKPAFYALEPDPDPVDES